MKERPILFSAPIVRAILEGRKTMTRRAVKFNNMLGEPEGWCHNLKLVNEFVGDYTRYCPYGVPGDRLWARETFGYPEQNCENGIVYRATDSSWDEAATKNTKTMIWKPSIFMPRRASRITLEVTGVRVERLHAITEEDAVREGVERAQYAAAPHCPGWRDYLGDIVLRSPRRSFETLWSKINGRDSWDANPWVWVVELNNLNMIQELKEE